jgi:hypothetical protein
MQLPLLFGSFSAEYLTSQRSSVVLLEPPWTHSLFMPMHAYGTHFVVPTSSGVHYYKLWAHPQAPPKPPREEFTLDTVIESEGSNLSVGERSLLSLARALVRDTRNSRIER